MLIMMKSWGTQNESVSEMKHRIKKCDDIHTHKEK